MTLPVTYQTVIELLAMTGSLLLGIIVLAMYGRERSGRLFGVVALAMASWKLFEFADPVLTTAAWVDSTGWALGALTLALAWHFVVSYTYRAADEPRLLRACLYPPAALLAVLPFLGSLRQSTAYQVLFAAYFLGGVGGIVAMTVRSYLKGRRRELIWALIGTLSIALGTGAHLVAILFGLESWRLQTYGMLAFEASFAYDIMVAGLLRERMRHMTALEELGLRERKLEMAEKGFRRLMETSFDILFTVDMEGNVQALSAEVEEIAGFKVKELKGKGYVRFLSSEDQARVADAVLRGMAGEKIRYLEVSLVQPGIRPLILQITATRLRGQERTALVIARDVTEARRMEGVLQERNILLEEANRRLRELDNLKTELVGVVGHELRSPLTVIYSYAAALKDHWKRMAEERKLECIDHVLRECNRLNRMVENVLDMSRIESERLFLHRREGNLVELLGEVTREMSMAPGARLTRMVTSVRRLDMEADWDKVKQVVINLLDNAFRFSPPGSQVLVTGDAAGGRAVVRVKDMGPGVPAEKKDRLFEKFTQSKAEGVERGLGLGLYIVRIFVEAHGGEVWLEDEEGFGTVIAFSLPLGAGEVEASA